MQFNASLAAPVARDTFAWVRADARRFALFFALSVAGGMAYDIVSIRYPDLFIVGQIALLAMNLVLQAWVTLTILERAGSVVPGTRNWRIGSLLGLGILYGLGVAFGLILLILPGIFFAARWYLAVPILLAENLGASEALSASWERTYDVWLSCAMILVLAVVWQIAPLVAGQLVTVPDSEWGLWIWAFTTNAISQAGWLFGIAAATTFYLHAGKGISSAAEIFG